MNAQSFSRWHEHGTHTNTKLAHASWPIKRTYARTHFLRMYVYMMVYVFANVWYIWYTHIHAHTYTSNIHYGRRLGRTLLPSPVQRILCNTPVLGSWVSVVPIHPPFVIMQTHNYTHTKKRTYNRLFFFLSSCACVMPSRLAPPFVMIILKFFPFILCKLFFFIVRRRFEWLRDTNIRTLAYVV